MKPTKLNNKTFLFQDQDAEWWRTLLHVKKVKHEEIENELRTNMDTSGPTGAFEYIMGYNRHCVYVQKYDQQRKRARGINSWGNRDQYPFVRIRDIQGLYRVSCTATIAGRTSWPYFWVKLTCVCLKFALKKHIRPRYNKICHLWPFL